MADDFGDKLVALLPNLRRFAIALCRSRDLADDLVQITCEKAIAGRESFDPATRLDAWLFRIMRNTWIDMARRKKTQGVAVDIADMPEAAVTDGAAVAENSLTLQSVFRVIGQLPEDQREVLMLVCVEDMSYKDAAEILGIPIGTVMSRLARARLAISKDIGIK